MRVTEIKIFLYRYDIEKTRHPFLFSPFAARKWKALQSAGSASLAQLCFLFVGYMVAAWLQVSVDG